MFQFLFISDLVFFLFRIHANDEEEEEEENKSRKMNIERVRESGLHRRNK